jgi:hypothetical protein
MTSVLTHCLPAGSPWATNQMGINGVNTTTTTFADAVGGAGNRRGRVIYFPSTGGSSNQILLSGGSGAWGGLLAFQTSMTQDGWQVLSVDELGEPSYDANADSGHGTRVVQTTLHYWDHIVLWANKTYGGPMPTIVCGLSRGAYNTMQVALGRQSQIIGFIARSSPTQWNAYPTDTGFGDPTMVGVNASGMNITTNSSVAITSTPTLVSTTLTLTTTGSFTGAGITVGSVITLMHPQSSLSPGGTYDNLLGSYTVLSGLTATTMTVTYTGSAPTGSYTSGGLVVSINTAFNGVTTPGIISYANLNELVAYYELATIAQTAINNGNTNIVNNLVLNSGHQWQYVDTAFYAAATWSSSVTYVANQTVYLSGNAYICILGHTNHTPPNATYWTLIGTQSAQGWVQTTFPLTSYPKIY